MNVPAATPEGHFERRLQLEVLARDMIQQGLTPGEMTSSDYADPMVAPMAATLFDGALPGNWNAARAVADDFRDRNGWTSDGILKFAGEHEGKVFLRAALLLAADEREQLNRLGVDDLPCLVTEERAAEIEKPRPS